MPRRRRTAEGEAYAGDCARELPKDGDSGDKGCAMSSVCG